MRIKVGRVDWEFRSPFRIAYKTRTHAQTVLVEAVDGALAGRGEALGVSYHGETVDSIFEQLTAVAGSVGDGFSRADLQDLLPAGGARNALDCALWDLESKRSGCRAWELAGIPTVHPLSTAYTLSVDTPEAMAKAAGALRDYPLLKIKLTGDGDVERVRRIRDARPDAALIVDANQAWNEQQLEDFTPQLAALGVKLIEQPMPIGADEALASFDSPIPLCADESCQTSESLPSLIGKYQYVNVKLDKTGGLSEALVLARTARLQGFKVMVGSMGGSSLSMAPAFLIGQLSDVVDLDAPLLITSDVPEAIRYEGDRVLAPSAKLWG